MQRQRQLIIGLLGLILCSCEGITQSSIPNMPVNITIDTRQGEFVHFTPEALTNYVVIDGDGYHYNGHDLPLPFFGAFGCGGVVIFVNMTGGYSAYDLACPYCYTHGHIESCAVDGLYANCPRCEEAYDISSGVGVPTKGIGHECLKSLPLTYVGSIIRIMQ